MPTPTNKSIEFLKWVEQNAKQFGPDATVYLDRITAPRILEGLGYKSWPEVQRQGYNTWRDILGAAGRQFTTAGGTDAQLKKYAPTLYVAPEGKIAGTPGVIKEGNPYLHQGPLYLLIQQHGLTPTIDDATGVQKLQGFIDKVAPGKERVGVDPVPIWLTMDANGAVTPFASIDKARDRLFSDLRKTDGGINSLFSTMEKYGFIDKSDFSQQDTDFTAKLTFLLTRYSNDIIDANIQEGEKDIPTFLEYIARLGKSIGGSKSETTVYKNFTKLEKADREINLFFIQNVGRAPSKEERLAYYNTLHAAEQKAALTRTTTSGQPVNTSTDIDATLSDADVLLIKGKIAGAALKNINIEKLLTGGSVAAQDLNDLSTFARNYGLDIPQEKLIEYVANNLTNGTDSKKTKAKFLKLAKAKYTNLADLIDEDTNINELAYDYTSAYSRLTGTPIAQVDVMKTRLIQNALANGGKPGKMSVFDFNQLVKSDPETQKEWLKTPEAKSEASGFALNILQSFGLVS